MESSGSSWVAMFVCANCARPGRELTSAGRQRPEVPDFGLPGRVQPIIIPCAGRLQPEHVLKALESGVDVVSVVACEDSNCHYAEGSRRCALRVDFIRSLLEEIGLGEGRLLLSHLPGSAAEDMAMASGSAAAAPAPELLQSRIAAIRDQVMEALRLCPANPFRASADPGPAAEGALPQGGGGR